MHWEVKQPHMIEAPGLKPGKETYFTISWLTTSSQKPFGSSSAYPTTRRTGNSAPKRTDSTVLHAAFGLIGRVVRSLSGSAAHVTAVLDAKHDDFVGVHR